MSKKIYFPIAVIAFIWSVVLMNSCRKDIDLSDLAQQNIEQSEDAEDINSAVEEIDDNIDIIASENGFKSTFSDLPCNVIIDSSLLINKKITITFSGDNCAGTRNCQGTVDIVLTNGARWKDAGAVITVIYHNLLITNNSTGKHITLNGTKTHTNVSGGLIVNLGQDGTPGNIIRKTEAENLKVTFTNGKQRNWNVARLREYTKSRENLLITVTGFGASEGHTNLVEWGTNRRGSSFFTEIVTPVVYSQLCDFEPSEGMKIHYVGSKQIEVILGVDASGNPVGEGCADYFKISWTTQEGDERTEIISYQR